jgi:hypothetical protein
MSSGRADAPGPDFLCIGMPKAGTAWLYDQLQAHPDFWIPPVKEMHYLDREVPVNLRARKFLKLPTPERRLAKRGKGEREWQFLQAVRNPERRPRDLEFYASLFRLKGDQLSGDITPSYSLLPEALIAEVMARFPQLKVILLVRDPVARAWSHFAMQLRGDKVEESVLRDPAKLRAILGKSKPTQRGEPVPVVKRWTRYVPHSQFRVYFFDDLQATPDILRRDILTFLDADPDQNPPGMAAGYNRKASKMKIEMTPEIEAVLVSYYGDELAACAETLGGHARTWAVKYGVVPEGVEKSDSHGRGANVAVSRS